MIQKIRIFSEHNHFASDNNYFLKKCRFDILFPRFQSAFSDKNVQYRITLWFHFRYPYSDTDATNMIQQVLRDLQIIKERSHSGKVQKTEYLVGKLEMHNIVT